MSDFPLPPRPATPQVLVHRLPDKIEDSDNSRKPEKYVVLISGSTNAPGKVQIAREVSAALSCAFYLGDSMHESAAKAASVGFNRQMPTTGMSSDAGAVESPTPLGPNEARYQRMWLSKMTRTGLLFPEKSRAAGEGFSGFGGASSTSTSRRGSASSVASVSSSAAPGSSIASSRRESTSFAHSGPPASSTFSSEGPVANLHTSIPPSEKERRRLANPVLMVLTHPELEQWHRDAIRKAVKDYSIGIIFVPLERGSDEGGDEEELPILRPLDPTTMTSFPTSFRAFASNARRVPSLDEELKLNIDIENDMEGQIAEITESVRDMINIEV
ncbi:hypothetical protein PFICI_08434 [Pestalotiopsis fici W106-1]|uniref:Uncharacterized protein n=1 Tax=Pestalotiopsis fici (strain W106-1 / CGMCC3.15140) TaxID=1229662 RepID=W3X4B7_PESFW|nr:uncharacterized protein PFICI_08434 [Pestalotiopsis fici W106-1]ETS80905.1 hypothetical protein PFICI_08434 [Pestalotiopsis fici W106-1]